MKPILVGPVEAVEFLRRIAPVKCIFADIPDNIGEPYAVFNDDRPIDAYYDWVWSLLVEVLPRCELFWLSYNAIHDLEIKWMVRDILRYRHPAFAAETYIWRYTFSQYNDKDCSHGYRPILRLRRAGAAVNTDAVRVSSRRQLIGDSRAAGDRVPDNVLAFPRVTGNSFQRRPWMPNQHPLELMSWIIRFSTFPGETFIDLMAGSGTSLRVGMDMPDRRVVSCDIDPLTIGRLVEELHEHIEHRAFASMVGRDGVTFDGPWASDR